MNVSEAIPAASRPIGNLLREACRLSDDQIDRIIAFQHQRGMRFGEAAVALRLVSRQDVLEALSRQFHYPAGFSGREGDSELASVADPFGDQADAFRELRTRLLLEVLGEGSRGAIAVVSPAVGDGKTYLAANLAMAFSQLGERTLLIDADLRTPRQHKLMHLGYRPGLSGVLAGFADADEPVCAVRGMPGLYVLPAGALPPNPLELLQRATFDHLVQRMSGKFDHVVIDTPAAARGADVRVIAARCHASIVVARRHRSPLAPLNDLVAALERAGCRIAGVVVNEH